jgi:hypothetical protein
MNKLSSMIDNGGMGLLLLAWTTATLGVLSIAL